MPNRNGTGPEGKGSKTGRQMGNCEGAQKLERNFGNGQGRGFGRGFGRPGRGMGYRQNRMDSDSEDKN